MVVTGFDFPHPVPEAQIPAQRIEVYIEVSALPAQLAPVRVVAAELAARADFDLDAVSDLRIAVDEACATLAALAPRNARLRCVIQVDPDRITVTVRVPVPASAVIAQDTFGWRVLDTLIDELEVLTEDGAGVPSLGIKLVKARQAGAP
jgi:serine/threonine-protein kinase RsbW